MPSPIEPSELSPLRQTTLVHYSLYKSIYFAIVCLIFTIGFFALSYLWIPSCMGWGVLALGIVSIWVTVEEARKIFFRREVLIVDEKGFTDTRTQEKKGCFIPWKVIVGASSFRLNVNLSEVKDTLKVSLFDDAGNIVEQNVDTTGLTMNASQIAEVIRKHLRALGRNITDE